MENLGKGWAVVAVAVLFVVFAGCGPQPSPPVGPAPPDDPAAFEPAEDSGTVSPVSDVAVGTDVLPVSPEGGSDAAMDEAPV